MDRGTGGQTDDLAQHGPLVRHAGARCVEVDNVDPRCSAGDVARRQVDRVAVPRLPVEIALGQTDRRSAAQVDGRKQLHHTGAIVARATKLASSASPVVPDFSGWNWAPQSGPRVASAATGTP